MVPLGTLGDLAAEDVPVKIDPPLPGSFVVPPAKAKAMYSPEVFGRSGSDWVIVK
jgi:hypothetical protein